MFKAIGIYKVSDGGIDQFLVEEYQDVLDLDLIQSIIEDDDSLLQGLKCYDGKQLVWHCRKGEGLLVDKLGE